ncbi:MAG: hypothetical protein FJ272_23645, partial [Planctomycetes bacterium]|nr:hypothetical protein [Planctomycetota bacterium]
MKAVSVLTIAIVFLLTGLPTVHGQGQADLPHVKATRVQADVKVDGRLDEAVWKDVPVMSGFQALTGKKKAVAAPEETRFQVAFNDHALLIGIVCREPRMGELIGDVTERDGSVWRDDSVEIFVQPGPRFYYHLGVNSRGTLYDARVPVTVQVTEKDIREGRLWDGVWEAVVSRATDAWTIEARIPFATLDLSPDTPSTWRLNVGRTAARRVEYSAWAPVEKGFHDLPRFGYLDGLRLDTSRFVLDGSGIAFPPLFVGNNHVPLSLPVRRDGRFRVGTSLREWSPGPPPERRPQGGPVAASGGNLP